MLPLSKEFGLAWNNCGKMLADGRKTLSWIDVEWCCSMLYLQHCVSTNC